MTAGFRRTLKASAAACACLFLLAGAHPAHAQWWEDEGLFEEEREFEGYRGRAGEDRYRAGYYGDDLRPRGGLGGLLRRYSDEEEGFEDYGGYYEDEGLFGED